MRPGWIPIRSVALVQLRVDLRVNGTPDDLLWNGRFLTVSTPDPQIEIEYGLPAHLTWRGDDVIGLDPKTHFLPFYPSTPG